MRTQNRENGHTHTDTQNDYCNPRCTCAPKVNNTGLNIGKACICIQDTFHYSHSAVLVKKKNNKNLPQNADCQQQRWKCQLLRGTPCFLASHLRRSPAYQYSIAPFVLHSAPTPTPYFFLHVFSDWILWINIIYCLDTGTGRNSSWMV